MRGSARARAIAAEVQVQPLPRWRLLALTCAAVLIEGYHFGVDDGAIYIPAAEKAADPRLFPFGADFFLSHARLSVFGSVVGDTARLLHVSAEMSVLLWYVACVFLLLLAAWQIACVFFASAAGRWGAVTLLATVLPVPAAGTALFLSDNYLSARSFSTPCTLLAIAFWLRGRRSVAAGCLLLAALFHPQMAVYGAALLVLLWWLAQRDEQLPGQNAATPIASAARSALTVVPPQLFDGFSLRASEGAYRAVLHSRTYFFASQWEPYEWIGAMAPLALLAVPAFFRREGSPAMVKVSRALCVLGLVAIGGFLLVSFAPALDTLARLQPMRVFHLVYLLFFLMLGGWLGERVLQGKVWRWALLFVALASGMYALDRSMYPFSPHLELPGRPTSNAWIEAFHWVRDMTPVDAVFALDPQYTAIRGEDTHGFRALAERSALADAIKDSGAVTMFPRLLETWETHQRIQRGWRQFRAAEFEALARTTPVTWVVVEREQAAGLRCPYVNAVVAVCKVGATAP